MKRLLATIAVAAAVAGCGGTQSHQASASAQCAHWKAAAQTFAKNFVSDIPSTISQNTVQQLAATSYKADATSHNLVCN